MAAQTWFATSNQAFSSQEMSLTDPSPGAEAYASPATGWIVGTGATNHGRLIAQNENTAFASTIPPDGNISTNGDTLRSTSTVTGTYDAGVWTFSFACRAQTNASGQGGRARIRVWKAVAEGGATPTEITAGAHVIGTAVTTLLTTVTQTSTCTTASLPSVTLTNEYLFVEVAWERQVAGSMSSADVNMRIGTSTGTRLVTPNFTAPAEPSRPHRRSVVRFWNRPWGVLLPALVPLFQRKALA